jgi:beta-galactosidase GanA
MKRLTVSILAVIAVLTVSAQRLSMPILGGELSNSAATSVADIDEVMPRMRALGLNTVLVPAYWELIEPREQSQPSLNSTERRQKSTEGQLMEPTEGLFDFTLIDRTIDVAKRERLHVAFLWFGAW